MKASPSFSSSAVLALRFNDSVCRQKRLLSKSWSFIILIASTIHKYDRGNNPSEEGTWTPQKKRCGGKRGTGGKRNLHHHRKKWRSPLMRVKIRNRRKSVRCRRRPVKKHRLPKNANLRPTQKRPRMQHHQRSEVAAAHQRQIRSRNRCQCLAVAVVVQKRILRRGMGNDDVTRINNYRTSKEERSAS